MQYDPKLKKAMEQIKKIMKENDIGGVVILHTPGWVEYMNKVNPTYSCASFTPDLSAIRFKSKKDMYAGGAEERNKVISETENLFANVIHIMGECWMMWDSVFKQFEKAVGPYEHTSSQCTSHEEQNN